MATELEKYKKKIAKSGGSATLAKHGKDHYKKMRAVAGDRSYFKGVQDGLLMARMNSRNSEMLDNLQDFIARALDLKQYDKLNAHKIISQFK